MEAAQVVSILGTGFMGGVHARAWKEAAPNLEIVGYSASGTSFRGEGNISDGNTSKIADLNVTNSLDRAFDLPPGSIVDICLPTKYHKYVTLRAIESGFHVMIEKPLVITEADAREILEVSKKNQDLRVMPAHCIRFWPAYEHLHKITQEKTLGELQAVKLKRQGAMPKAEHFGIGSESGGALRDLLTHDIDFADLLVGGLNNREFFANGVKGKSNAWDNVNIAVNAARGVAVGIEGGWQVPEKFPFEMSFEARFELGVLSFQDNVLTLYSNTEGRDPVVIELSAETGWQREIKHFFECVSNPEIPLRVTVDDAVKGVAFASRVEHYLESRVHI
jgi:predicted dehydrogenase